MILNVRNYGFWRQCSWLFVSNGGRPLSFFQDNKLFKFFPWRHGMSIEWKVCSLSLNCGKRSRKKNCFKCHSTLKWLLSSDCSPVDWQTTYKHFMVDFLGRTSCSFWINNLLIFREKSRTCRNWQDTLNKCLEPNDKINLFQCKKSHFPIQWDATSKGTQATYT